MTLDYDLVIIGNTPEAYTAARRAVTLNARVALVEQHYTKYLPFYQSIYRRSLAQGVGLSGTIPISKLKSWTDGVFNTIQAENSLEILASVGVDVIKGVGEFCRLPSLAFIVNQRKLRSRAYLIATSSRIVLKDIPGIEETNYLTLEQIYQHPNIESLPQNLIIIAGNPGAIELAQSLQRLGKEITLVVNQNNILPQEDIEGAMLIQAQLEAEGMTILTDSPAILVKTIEDKKWVQAGDLAIEADEIIFAQDDQPNIEGLNLEGVGVELGKHGIKLNSKLQTTNPRIYGCGNVAGGYPFTHIAEYEANIAVNNALMFPFTDVDYCNIPWVIFTDPPLARVGMTEKQARKRYGKDVLTLRQYFKNIPLPQMLGETTGLCKLIIRGNGEILGAHIVGLQASEFIGVVALAMKEKIKLSHTTFTSPNLTSSEILHQLAWQWQSDRLLRNKTLQKLLETWFIWRRR